MKRLLLLIVVFLLGSSYTRSASARMGMGMGKRNNTPIGEEIQKKRQEILRRQQSYTNQKVRASAARLRFHPSGRTDGTGRFDLSGKPAPGYPTIHDGTVGYSTSRYSRGRRAAVHRPQAPRPSLGLSAGAAPRRRLR